MGDGCQYDIQAGRGGLFIHGTAQVKYDNRELV